MMVFISDYIGAMWSSLGVPPIDSEHPTFRWLLVSLLCSPDTPSSTLQTHLPLFRATFFRATLSCLPAVVFLPCDNAPALFQRSVTRSLCSRTPRRRSSMTCTVPRRPALAEVAGHATTTTKRTAASKVSLVHARSL